MEENEIIKKIIGHGALEFQNGELQVMKIPTVLLPLNTYVMLENEIYSRFGPEGRDILYYLAKYQAQGGTKILHQQYGFKEMRTVVDLELQTCALMGMGFLHLIRYDEANKVAIVKFLPNPAAKLRKKIFGVSNEATDHFGRGGMAGIFSYAFNTDMVAIETMCEHCGKPYCEIEVREKSAWDMNDATVKNQFPLAEEKYSNILKNYTALMLLGHI